MATDSTRRAIAGTALGLAMVAMLGSAGCSGGKPSVSAVERQKQEVRQRIAGVWRLTSYIPDQELSVALLMSMQSDRIIVRFEDNRIKSATSLMSFDRGYRIDSVQAEGFKMFIQDDDGAEYEVWGQFDDAGSLLFNARTPPWTGKGQLDREGSALTRQQ